MTENATILDPTAGNRGIWSTKEHPNVLWIDIEPELEIPPDIVMDCTKTEFSNKRFNAIFFDPPHLWGKELGDYLGTIRNRRESKQFYPDRVRGSTYYGWDKYKTKSELLSFIHKAQKEFHRILKDEGMLWVKWNENGITLQKILPFFKNLWSEMLRFPLASVYQTHGKTQTYWVMFMKKPNVTRIMDLSDIPSNNGIVDTVSKKTLLGPEDEPEFMTNADHVHDGVSESTNNRSQK